MSWTRNRLLPPARTQLSLLLLGCAACGDPPAPDVVDAGTPDGTRADAAADARTQGSSDGSNPRQQRDANSGADRDDGQCARVDARPRPKATAVWFVINPITMAGILATENAQDETTNMEMFRELLFGTSGVVPNLGATIQFGLAAHTVQPGGPLGGTCPSGVFVPAALNNASKLEEAYQNLPSHQGATWGSLDLVAKEIERRTEPTQDTILLIQSSHGDAGCQLFVSAPDLQRTAIRRLAEGGARVSVVSLLHKPSQASNAEQRNAAARALGMQLAELGNGEAFASDQAAAIREAIEKSVDHAVSCEIHLEGKVEQGLECEGEVTLGGDAIRCNDPDGFKLRDESTIELTGDACTRLRNDAAASLSATFPCDAFVPII